MNLATNALHRHLCVAGSVDAGGALLSSNFISGPGTKAPLAISSWSVTELHSALGLKVRSKALNQAQAEAILQGFERSLAPGLLLLELEPLDFRNANACLRGWITTLRAADALHLAIASARGATLCSLDAPFVAAAKHLGLEAELLVAGGKPVS